MKALHYAGPFKTIVKEIETPKLVHPDDVLVHVTTACICGSDLHMYQGRTAAQPGLVFGHENMGIVEGETITGGQAQYIRIPYADFNALKLPQGTQHETDFALLADIFPTGWHGLTLAGFKPGESVAVFGAGPVGLMAAYSGIIRGASRVYVVDKVRERLDQAEKIGCVSIDFTVSDPVQQITKHNGGEVDRAVDAVGYQAVGSDGAKEVPNTVLDSIIAVTRPTGGLGIPGLYVPADPGAPDEKSKKGQLLFSFGKLFEKGLKLGTGQCDVKAYNRYLRDLIIAGKAKPSFVVSHEIGVDEAPAAYEKFNKREDGYVKVLIHPNGPLY
ncbi:MAG: hypothetical protein M1831_004568 [Alyxoria varia]|nr:MAG: hypothetical protein M1831_004568 [Alyxoria varia]